MTEEEKERIKELQEWFETDEDLADGDRMLLGSRISTLEDYYRGKCKAYESLENIDSEMITSYSEYKTLCEFLRQLHESYIRLDNFRCHNITRLCSLLRYTDLELSDKIKNNIYW
jgi:hypothetical protein